MCNIQEKLLKVPYFIMKNSINFPELCSENVCISNFWEVLQTLLNYFFPYLFDHKTISSTIFSDFFKWKEYFFQLNNPTGQIIFLNQKIQIKSFLKAINQADHVTNNTVEYIGVR